MGKLLHHQERLRKPTRCYARRKVMPLFGSLLELGDFVGRPLVQPLLDAGLRGHVLEEGRQKGSVVQGASSVVAY